MASETLTVATCFWTPNKHTAQASQVYAPEWVNRLARGVRRNLTVPHRFVVLTDREYEFEDGIEQERLSTDTPDWSCMIEPFRIDGPLMVVGLDTVIVGNIDALAHWTLNLDRMALPRSPGKDYACNAIALVPQGHQDIFMRWRGENDMEWLRTFPHTFIEERFPGWVSSYKCDIRPNGLGETRIAYMHGRPKMDEIEADWVRDHWR